MDCSTPLEAELRLTPRRGVQQFFEELGPGLITGAAWGISTYSVAGASYWYATLWTTLLSFPLMPPVQLMGARLDMVTGCGLASVIRTRYPRWVATPYQATVQLGVSRSVPTGRYAVAGSNH
jgi:Mn2+/Fe2+ NRAMP family transporter